MANNNYRQLRTARAQNVPLTIKRVLSYILKHNSAKFVLAIICLIISSLTGVANSYFFDPIINKYLVPYIGMNNPDLSGFIKMLVLMAFIYLLGVSSSYLYRKMISYISTGMLDDLRKDLFTKMQKLPISFFDRRTHGEVMNYYSNDIDLIRPMIAETLPTLISTCLTLLGSIIMMLISNIKLSLVAIFMLGVMMFSAIKLSKTSNKYFAQLQRLVSQLNGYIEEMFSGQKVIKIFCHEEENIKECDEICEELLYNNIKTNTMASLLMPINMNISYFTYALIAVLGSLLYIKGEMTLGALASFLLYVRQFSGPINNLSSQFNGFMMSLAGAERVFGIMDLNPEVDEGKTTLVNVSYDETNRLVKTDERTGLWAWEKPDGELIRLKGDVRLDNVTFGYVENKTVLKNISLYAKPGQKIAFVGSTGAGKTTITNLLNRFYDIEEGTITFDGINIKDIKKDDLRRSIGFVLQDTNLFSGTVIDNIRYGRLDATDEECIAAAKRCNADSFISRLPEGYQTILSANGANLSQGQRQLLNIARCAVADPPVMVLDEATSSIDTHTEKLIEKGMDELMEGRTTFVIAHRLSTVRNSNAIMVIEHGEIIERGDHESLLKEKGRYYKLYTGKAELD